MAKYEAFSGNGKRATLEADSLYAAKQAAVALFKPAKSKQHMVSVVLIERSDGTAVSLHNSNADWPLGRMVSVTDPGSNNGRRVRSIGAWLRSHPT